MELDAWHENMIIIIRRVLILISDCHALWVSRNVLYKIISKKKVKLKTIHSTGNGDSVIAMSAFNAPHFIFYQDFLLLSLQIYFASFKNYVRCVKAT